MLLLRAILLELFLTGTIHKNNMNKAQVTPVGDRRNY